MKRIDPDPVNVVAAPIYGDERVFQRALRQLVEMCGEVDFVGEPHPFDCTDYYEGEMGKGLKRRIVSFSELVDPSFLPELKEKASSLEDDFRVDGKRTVNVDVGYLDYHKLVLASWKGRGNKVYLSRGVWADVTVFFQKGRVIPLEWSFPDFRAGIYDADLLRVRALYREKMRRKRSGG